MILKGILRKQNRKEWAFDCGEGGAKVNTIMNLHIPQNACDILIN
jgi:hypothetical protein